MALIKGGEPETEVWAYNDRTVVLARDGNYFALLHEELEEVALTLLTIHHRNQKKEQA